MDFTPSSEQEMMRDSARRYLADDFSARRRNEESTKAAKWRGYAELGWLALMAPEDVGGLGGDIADVLILVEEMGRALSLQPYVASGILATRLVECTAGGAQRFDLLATMISGEQRLAPALYEPGRRYSLVPETRAKETDSGYQLSGKKCLIAGGAGADGFLVSAQLDSGSVGLFLVKADHPSVIASLYSTIDDGDMADAQFKNVNLDSQDLLGIVSAEMFENALDEARLALCADTLGALEAAVQITADYLKTRKQFGQLLSNFQALQHSLVEMYIEVDAMRSSLFNAIAAFHQGERTRRRRAVASCWVKIFDAAKGVAGMAVHLHGGIGMTVEYPVGHYLRRVMVSERIFGDVEFHLESYIAMSASDPERQADASL